MSEPIKVSAEMMEDLKRADHAGCFQFDRACDGNVFHVLHVGRLQLGEHVIRLWLSPKGLHAGIPKAAIADGTIVIGSDFDQAVHFAGFGGEGK